MARSLCYPRLHMTLEQYGLYKYACEVSYASGKYYMSGPKTASEFAGTGKNAIYRVGRKLVDAGWFEVITPRYRDQKTGMWRPMIVKPLTHDEWKWRYPDARCPSLPEPKLTMTDSGHGAMTESGKGTMTDFESSMTDCDAIHDRIREQVLEVSSEVRESAGNEKDARSQGNTSQAEGESGVGKTIKRTVDFLPA